MRKLSAYTLLICLFFGSFHYAKSQKKSASDLIQQMMQGEQNRRDSLLAVLKSPINDTTRLNAYNMLCRVMENKYALTYGNLIQQLTDKLLTTTKDTTERKKLLKRKGQAYIHTYYYYISTEGAASKNALSALQKALLFFEKAKDQTETTNTLIEIAGYYGDQGNILKRLELLKEGLDICKKNNYKKGMARFNLQITYLYAEEGDTLEALNQMEKGITLEKEIADSTRIARGYILSGSFYLELLHYDKAIEFFNKAIERYTYQKEMSRLPRIYMGISEAYREKGDFLSALKYTEKGAALAEEMNDPVNLFFSIVSKGEIYEKQGDIEKALEQHHKALLLAEQSKLEEPIVGSCIYLAQDYFRKKDFKKAKFYSDRALLLINGKSSVQHSLEREKLAYKIDSAGNNYKGAYEHYQKYILFKNKLNNEEVHKAATRERFQNDLEKQKLEDKARQDKKDAINAEEKEKQKIIIYSVSAGLFLVLLLVLFVFRGLRQKQKANKELLSKNEVIAQQKHLVEEKHKEITDSINYAERIQRSFLASKELLDTHLKEYFIFFKPKDVVSGDFYWADTLNDGNFILATADSTGHGVPGAIMSLLNITSLEKACEHKTNPAEILDATRKTIITRLKKDGSAEGGKDGMDCSLVIFDFKKKHLQIAAANNPVWIVRASAGSEAKELIEIKPDKMPVGKHDKDKELFNTHVVDLLEGDIIYTLTDGFADQFGGTNGKKFMSKNLKELLVRNSALNMDAQKKVIESVFTNWLGDYEQVDDITVIGIKI